METNKPQYQKKGKNPQSTRLPSSIYTSTFWGKSLKNLLLIIETLGCRHLSALLAKQSCAAARGLKSQISCPILQLCGSNMEDLIVTAEAPVEHGGSIQAEICAAFWARFAPEGLRSWLCSELSCPDLLFHKGQACLSESLALQPADHAKSGLHLAQTLGKDTKRG